MEQVKVGDTFRVFEVVKSTYFKDFTGYQTIEVKDDCYQDDFVINTFLNCRSVKNLHFFVKNLKQVATVRITKLK